MTSTITFHVGDVRDVLAAMPDSSVDLLVTSPPFLALRSYLPDDHPDKHREIGSEPTPAAFLDTMLALTADWRRVVADWGSIAVEIGDTYRGSGGAGGDYGPDGMRAGQPKWRGNSGNARRGWPLAKSLCGIPTLYTWSLAYGRNLLTGTPSPAGQWRVRNLLTWTRPNPPVGALGDKFRPATSFVTVATVDDKRWFDLDAVRGEALPPTRARPRAVGAKDREIGKDGPNTGGNPAGAPPLDWWDANDCDPDDWQPLHRLPTQPYKGKTTTARRVPCGPDDGGERTASPDCPRHGDLPGQVPTALRDARAAERRGEPPHTRRSGSHPDDGQHPGSAPTDLSTERSTGQPAPPLEGSRAATPHSTTSRRTDPAPSTSQPGTPSAGSPRDTTRTSASPSSTEPRPSTDASSTELGDSASRSEPQTTGDTDDTPQSELPCTCSFHKVIHESTSHYAAFPVALPRRLIDAMCPREVCSVCGEPRRRLTATNYAAPSWSSGGRRNGLSRQADRTDQAYAGSTIGWTDCGHDTYRPGIVLDPFGGSGTTAVAAAQAGRDAVLIDIDRRNVDLARHRIADAMQIVHEEIDGDTWTWTVDPGLPGLKGEHPDQLSLLGDIG